MKGIAYLGETFRRRVFVAAFYLLTLGYCAAASTSQMKLAAANSSFAFKLLTQLAKEQSGSNIFISPYSASTVLQMVCNGAKGHTLSEMQRVLGTTGLQSDALNDANKATGNSLNSGITNVVLTTANAIWYLKRTPIRPEFLACNQRFFGATVDALDFNDPHSVDIMNTWASDKTHGRIDRIADGLLDPLTEMILANAVYFKGAWDVPFDANKTKERIFHLRDGLQKKTPMMEQERRFDYRQGTGYQAVRLPYQGWKLAMYVFLPDVGSNPAKLLSILNGDRWQRVTEPGFSEREGTVVLPKFKLEYGVELKKPLKALGMNDAFAKADFSRMSDIPLFISAVRQRTFVEVNETGTEAAAVTVVGIGGYEETKPPFEMIVDRPFLFLIEDKLTRTILFMGILFDPENG